MAVNWFEGGRRITKLCMAIAALIGGYVAFFEANEPGLEFYTASPLDEWHLRDEDPEPPATLHGWEVAAEQCEPSETLWTYEIKPKLFRHIRLCYSPGDKSEAEIAEEMAGDDARITEARKEGYSDSEIIDYLYRAWRLENDSKRLDDVQLAASRARDAGENSDAAMLTEEAKRLSAKIDEAREALKHDSTASPDPYEGLGVYEEEAPESSSWWDLRVADFSITPAALAKIEKELPRIEREAFIDHVIEVSSITAYFIGGFWIFSFVIGWIVRGFAGIPRGQDFRLAA